jgi:ferredoxin-NADP reductase
VANTCCATIRRSGIGYVIGVLNEPAGRGGSRWMHEQIALNSELLVSPPRNQFPLAGREARFHLLLAGGISVTPMLAMIAELERRAAPWHMHYSCSPARGAWTSRPERRRLRSSYLPASAASTGCPVLAAAAIGTNDIF